MNTFFNTWAHIYVHTQLLIYVYTNTGQLLMLFQMTGNRSVKQVTITTTTTMVST